MMAWQLRESHQQQLLEEIMRGAHDAAETFESTGQGIACNFYLLAAHDLMSQFIASADKGIQYCKHLGNGLSRAAFVAKWVGGVGEKIAAFSQVNEEKDILKARLLEELIRYGVSHIKQAYDHKCIAEPEKIYDGKRAMDEVKSLFSPEALFSV